MAIKYDPITGKAVCATCGEPMAYAGGGLSGNKLRQLYTCSHIECPNRHRRLLSKEPFTEKSKRGEEVRKTTNVGEQRI